MRIDRRSVGVAAAGVGAFLNLYCTQALLPTLAAQFGVSLPQTGLVVTATLLAVAIVAPFVGSISDMLGRKRLIVAACFALIVPTLLAAGAGGLHALVLWRFVQGLLLPFIFAITVAYVGDECEGAEAIRMAGTFASGCVFGGFAGRLIAGWITSVAGWRMAFVAIAALTALVAVVIAAVLPPERRFRPVGGWRASAASFVEHLGNRRLLATCAIGFGVLFSQVLSFTYVNFLLAAPPYGLGPAQLGTVFTVYLLGLVVTPCATWIASRIGRRPTLAMAVAVGITGLMTTLAAPIGWIIGGLALVGTGTFVLQALSLGFIGAAVRRAKSAAVGLYVTSYYIGGSLGGILPAGIWHRYGWPGCVALATLVQLAMLTIAMRFWRDPAPARAAQG